MVGVVIVSHHAKLAEGIRDLAEQMVREPMPIAIAAGIDDPENPFGTDAMKIYAAIESVYSTDGVLVLMDLGSALLSVSQTVPPTCDRLLRMSWTIVTTIGEARRAVSSGGGSGVCATAYSSLNHARASGRR